MRLAHPLQRLLIYFFKDSRLILSVFSRLHKAVKVIFSLKSEEVYDLIEAVKVIFSLKSEEVYDLIEAVKVIFSLKSEEVYDLIAARIEPYNFLKTNKISSAIVRRGNWQKEKKMGQVRAKVKLMNFCSDNVTGASPEIMAALTAANEGAAMPYGQDECSQRLEIQFSELFETDVAVFPVATGSAANALVQPGRSKPAATKGVITGVNLE